MQINPAAHSLPVSLRYFDLVELSDLRDCLGVEHMDELLKVFAEALPLYSRSLNEATARADLVTAVDVVHTLRGTATSLGCAGLAVPCDAIRAACERNDVSMCRQAVAILSMSESQVLSEVLTVRVQLRLDAARPLRSVHPVARHAA